MQASTIKQGDTIGIVSPSHIAERDKYEKIMAEIQKRGFKVKAGKNLYKNTYGYLASETERAEDFNHMILDDEVKMVFFGGGEGAVELLPLINYEAIRENPKIFLSYSDGTSILNAIYAKTGLVTYYGQTPAGFADLRQYDYEQFTSHFLVGNVSDFVSNSKWHSLCEGICEGILIGGYTVNFALLANSKYLNIDSHKKYILFLEDHQHFTEIAGVSMFLSHIEQSDMINNVSGLIFGHYSETIFPDLMSRLRRFGEKHSVPVVYCDDFGHGRNHAILPIGRYARLNTKENTLRFGDFQTNW